MVAQGRYDDAYLLNRDSNVFPGILGRTCDRPCEPACRRVRVEEKPVAICRIKRVAADLKGDISARLPKAPATKNGKRVACIGAGPASLTVANDLMPLGYEVVVFEKNTRPGGLMRTNVPSFRLPAHVLDEEIAMIVDMGVEVRYGTPVQSLKALLGPGVRRRVRRLGRAARQGSGSAGAQGSGRAHPHRHRLAGERRLRSHQHDRRARPHHRRRQHRDGLLPHGAAPGRQGRQGDGPPRPPALQGLALGAGGRGRGAGRHPGQPRPDPLRRREAASWSGMEFERPAASGTGTEKIILPADDVIVAIGQENAFPFIERDIGIEFGKWDMPKVDEKTMAVDAAGGLLRRRRGLGPQEHHLGRRARARGGDLDPQPLPGASRSPSGRRRT